MNGQAGRGGKLCSPKPKQSARINIQGKDRSDELDETKMKLCAAIARVKDRDGERW
jgi:hypothetical protein